MLSATDFAETCEVWEQALEKRYRSDYERNRNDMREKADLSGSTANAIEITSQNEPIGFRQYNSAPQRVRDLYRQNHELQTLDFVLKQKEKYRELHFGKMSVWEALETLDHLLDESDPDTSLPQIMHALQSAEAARKDGQPRWMILTALIHDLGKLLFFHGEPQWAVVGDTFPVGCTFSDKIVYHDYFTNNPDSKHPIYGQQYGIYEPHCGFDQVHMSFGHDEYLYLVVKDHVPKEAAYIIRYHSFYAAHREHAYTHLMSDFDKDMMKWLHEFNRYDLYSKSDCMPSVEELKPFYLDLISEFFPNEIQF